MLNSSRGILGCFGMAALFALQGCASVSTKITDTDAPRAPLVNEVALSGSMSFEAAAKVQGDLVLLDLTQSERCEVTTTTRATRTRRSERHLGPDLFHPKYTAALGFLLAGAGLFFYFDAERFSQEDMLMGGDTSPEEYRAYGVATVGVGLVSGVIAVVDLVRSQDSVDDLGVVDLETKTAETVCHLGPAANRNVRARLGSSRFQFRTDESGRGQLALTQAPASDLSPEGDAIYLEIGDKTSIRVNLSPEQLAEVREALAANPESRFAKDEARRVFDTCRAAVARSSGGLQASLAKDPQTVIDAWATAKQDCGAHWTPADEDVRLRSLERAIAARCERTLEEARAILPKITDGDELELGVRALSQADAHCAKTRELEPLRKALEAAAARVAQQEAEAEAAAQREADYQALLAHMRDGEVEQALHTIRANPGIRALIDDEGRELAWLLAGVAMENVQDSTPSRKEAEVTMCQARTLLHLLIGKNEVARTIRAYMDREGNASPAATKRMIDTFKKGRCK